MVFRDRLLATLRAVQPILEVPGVLVVGSEVPNLLEPAAASTLVVSQDVDLGIPVEQVDAVVACLDRIAGLRPSDEEPSVWVPTDAASSLIEVNFLGVDAAIDHPRDTYVREHVRLPLMVFGPLSLLRPRGRMTVDGVAMTLPRPAGLAVEKLVTDRADVKGERDLLVVAGLLSTMTSDDLDELEATVRGLPADLRHEVRSNLRVLSLLKPVPAMPDPVVHRAAVHAILERLGDE